LTSSITWERNESLPVFKTFTVIEPPPLIAPPITVLPFSFKTGLLSPVNIDSFTVVSPSITIPSAGIYSTGELGTWVKEQSLIVNTERGLIVITGCAHPGVVKIINTAKELLGKPVLLVLGGFHLVGRSKQEIDRIIHGFRNLGVHFVGPCHCSGDLARELFKKEYKKNFINIGVGRVITMDDLK